MANNAAYKGDVIPFTNTAAATIENNALVAIDTTATGVVTAGATLCGIALKDIAQNETAQLAIENVWECDKDSATDVFEQGAEIGVSSGKVVPATSTNLVVNARVYKKSDNGEATVFVKLG